MLSSVFDGGHEVALLCRVSDAGHEVALLCRVFVSETPGSGGVNCFKTEHSVNEVHKWLGGDTAGWKGKHNRLRRFVGTRKARNSRRPQYMFPCRRLRLKCDDTRRNQISSFGETGYWQPRCAHQR